MCIQFFFNDSTVHGFATRPFENYPHIYRLSRIMHHSLPPTIIIKIAKPGVRETEEFNNEKAMYSRLRRLQSHVIPVCFGEARLFWGGRALVLSDIQGSPVLDDNLPHSRPPTPIFHTAIQRVMDEFIRYHVVYSNHNMHDFFWVRGRIMVVDLEGSTTHRSATTLREAARENVQTWVNEYATRLIQINRIAAVLGVDMGNH